MPGAIRLSICWLLILSLQGCAVQTVKPWERGELATPEMAWEPDAGLADYREHARFSKEAAFGLLGDTGGGCGCN